MRGIGSVIPWAPLLRSRRGLAWALATVLCRLPSSMSTLTLVYLGRDNYGGFTAGAWAAGAFAVGGAAGGLIRGRHIDRSASGAVVAWEAALAAAAYLVVVGIAGSAGPTLVLWVAAAAAGSFVSGTSAACRTLAVRLREEFGSDTVFSADAFLMATAFVAGPSLAAALVSATSSTMATACMAALLAVGACLLRLLPWQPHGPSHARHQTSPIRKTFVQVLLAVALIWCVTIGTFQTITPVNMSARGLSETWAGAVLTAFSVGSIISGLMPLPQGRSAPQTAATWLGFFAVAMLGVSVSSHLALLIPLAALAGVPVTQLNRLAAQMLTDVVHPSRQTETFSLYSAALGAGGGVGAFATGVALSAGHGPLALPITAGILLLTAGAVLGYSRKHLSRHNG